VNSSVELIKAVRLVDSSVQFCGLREHGMEESLNSLDIIFLSSLRLDVRKPKGMDICTYSCDDLLFDLCTSEDYIGE
jgi:hypothetical protein